MREAGGDLRFADGQEPDSRVLGEGGNCLQVRGLHRSVVADRVLRTGVDTPRVAVHGSYLVIR